MTTAATITPPKERTTPSPQANGHDSAALKPEAPAPRFDFTALSDEQLDLHLADAQADKKRREAAALAAMARVFGIPVERLKVTIERETAARARAKADASDSTDGRKDVKPLYWSPSDHSQRWSGRGKEPEWVRTLLAQGVTKEQMRIPEGAV